MKLTLEVFGGKILNNLMQQCNAKVILYKLTCVLPREVDENTCDKDYQSNLHLVLQKCNAEFVFQ